MVAAGRGVGGRGGAAPPPRALGLRLSMARMSWGVFPRALALGWHPRWLQAAVDGGAARACASAAGAPTLKERMAAASAAVKMQEERMGEAAKTPAGKKAIDEAYAIRKAQIKAEYWREIYNRPWFDTELNGKGWALLWTGSCVAPTARAWL